MNVTFGGIVTEINELQFFKAPMPMCWMSEPSSIEIRPEQFKNAYLAIIKDMRDPDLGDEIGSNWNRVYNSIVTSVNS